MAHQSRKLEFTRLQIVSFTILRLSMGWLFLYAGIIKLIDSNWTSAGYLQSAQTFTSFYHLLLDPMILPIVDFLNVWGLIFLGASLLFGVFVRASSFLGIILMLLYYFPVLNGFYPNSHSFLIDEHIIYALVLFLFFTNKAGCAWGIGPICLDRLKIKKTHWMREWLS